MGGKTIQTIKLISPLDCKLGSKDNHIPLNSKDAVPYARQINGVIRELESRMDPKQNIIHLYERQFD